MQMLTDFHFLRPYWLGALAPLLLLLVLHWRRRAGASVWRKLVDAHLLPHLLSGEDAGPRRLPLVLLALGWLALVLALAGPVWERLPQPVFSTSSQRIILLDLSPSMNAADVSPSRLARARFEILDLLRASREGEVGLIAFGPEPFVVSPLSGDAKTVAAQVPPLSTDLVPAPGPRRSDLALDAALAALDQGQAVRGDVILVTDALGDPAASLEAAHRLAARGHRLSVLALGTAKGAPVPTGQGGFAQTADGAIELARLEGPALRELAKAGGGIYVEARLGEADTQALARRSPALDAQVQQTALSADQWQEEGPWLLLVLLPLAALAFRRGWLLPALAVVLILPSSPSQALTWADLWQRPEQQAARHLAAGRAAEAARRFEDPAWRAAASYRAGDYERALKDVSALKGADADFNRGNALARLGRLAEAADAYGQALKQDPAHADAQHNLELVQKLLEQPRDQQKDKSQQEDKRQEEDQGQPQGQDGSPQKGEGQGAEAAQGGSESDASDTSSEPSSKEEGKEPRAGESGQPSGAQGDHEHGGSGGASSDQPGQELPPAEKAPRDAGAGAPAGSPDTATRPPDAGDLRAAGSSAEPAPEPKSDSERDDTPGALESGGAEGSPDTRDKNDQGPTLAADAPLTAEEREQQQSMEAQLRRVPDDPAGLLRQRFLLQHLRREGRLP